MKRRILVTGATTPIGRETVRRLVEHASVERVVAVGTDGDSAISDPRVEYVTTNLARHRSAHDLLFGVVREIEIDTIVHLALHRSARREGAHVRALNVDATRDLLKMAERHPTVQRFVFRSFSDVYHLRPDRPTIIEEDHPIELSPDAPQWVRDRLEADLVLCTAMGLSPLAITVLRMAECVAPESGSQLHDYLSSRVCLRPAGFDPMLNVLTVADAAHALTLAATSEAKGVFNIPGYGTLPLSRIIALSRRLDVPTPGPVVAPLYGLRARLTGTDFRYDLNELRFHLGGVLDGRRAKEELGYVPRMPVDWDRRDGCEA